MPESVVPQEAAETSLPEIKEADFVDNSEPQPKEADTSTTYRVTYGTGFPIDVIYGYINRDFESKGYDDAMVNTELSYKDTGKRLIVNGLMMLFKQVDLRYQQDLSQLEVMIETMQGQGLPLQVMTLQRRKKLLESHVAEISQMKIRLEKEEESMMRMVTTYERGFMKGLVAKSNSILNGNQYKLTVDANLTPNDNG